MLFKEKHLGSLAKVNVSTESADVLQQLQLAPPVW